MVRLLESVIVEFLYPDYRIGIIMVVVLGNGISTNKMYEIFTTNDSLTMKFW